MTAVSLLELLREWSDRDPDGKAVSNYDVHTSRDRGELSLRCSRTARQMWDDVVSLAVALKVRGLDRGDIVAVQLPNWHEWIVTHLALYAIGVVIMPISPVYRTRDVARQLEIAEVKALVVPSSFGTFDYLSMAEELRGKHEDLKFIVGVGEVPSGSSVLSWGELIEVGASAEQAELRTQIAEGQFAHGVDDFMLLNFTSGTTGEPKGVMHSTTTISSVVSVAARRFELTSADIVFVAVTLGHAGGFLNGIYLPLIVGTRIVFMDLWDAGLALQIVERERISYGPAMPPYLLDMIGHPSFATTDVSSWRRARVSGGVMPRHVIATLHEQIPTIRLCPGWGMSELSYVTCGSPHDPIEKLNQTDGFPLDPCEIQIRDASGETQLPTGVSGEIVVRSPGQMLGYFGRDELTQSAITPDGWFKSGDVGRIDEDGYLTIVGRSKDIILRGGENVPVVEVELLIREHPRVNAVALVGVPDVRLGERVCAVVELSEGAEPLTLEELRDFLSGQELTRQYIPEHLVLMDELPRTSSGKILKAKVRELMSVRFAQDVEAH